VYYQIFFTLHHTLHRGSPSLIGSGDATSSRSS